MRWPGPPWTTGRLTAADPGQHVLWIHGSQGYCAPDLIAGALAITGHDGSADSPDPLPEAERYPRFAPAHDLVEVILRGAKHLAPGELGRLAVDFLDAAYRSAASDGRPVTVAE